VKEPLIPHRVMHRTLMCWPEKTGVVDGESDFTYAEFNERNNRLCNALLSLDVKKRDHIATLLPNVHESMESHYAISKLDCVIVAMNTRLSPNELEHIINHSDSRLLIVDWEYAHLIYPIRDRIPDIAKVIVTSGGPKTADLEGLDYETLLGSVSPQEVDLADDEDAVASILYTSGTTARPKGAVITHRQNYMRMLQNLVVLRAWHDDVYLHFVPMFHAQAWGAIWSMTGVGATHVCLRRIEPGEILRLMETCGVTALCSASTILNMVANHTDFPRTKFSPNLRIVTAASSPPPALFRAWEAAGAHMIHSYGLTEVLWGLVNELGSEWDGKRPEERADHIAKQGISEFHCLTKVGRQDMTEVRHDGKEVGEVLIKGPTVMSEYYKNPEDSEKAFRGGWLHTGDLAVVHPDHHIEIVDREKDTIISGGENIGSAEVEAVLYEHPAILECALIAVPSEKWGEEQKAMVVLKPGAKSTERELIDFTRERLAHYKCPKSVEFLSELPKTATGKIQKYVLREPYWEGQRKRVK